MLFVGESITLESPVRAEGTVELWLMRLLQESQRSLHSIIRLASQAIGHADVNMIDLFNAFPSQVAPSFSLFLSSSLVLWWNEIVFAGLSDWRSWLVPS